MRKKFVGGYEIKLTARQTRFWQTKNEKRKL
jgi:hypothetical protein